MMMPLFRVKLARMATEKKVFVNTSESSSPMTALKTTVNSPLIKAMFNTYLGTLSGVFVVFDDRGMGKTEAAMYFLKSHRPQSPRRGIMVGGASQRSAGYELKPHRPRLMVLHKLCLLHSIPLYRKIETFRS
jgi:hypothetical protein